MNQFRKMGLGILVLAFMSLVFVTPGAAEDTIKLGVSGDHTGKLASYGIPTVRAAELVVEKFNAKGGVLGKKVELLVEDDQCKPELATNAATKLVGDGAHVVIGHICSGATKAALGIYLDSKVIAMSSSATATDLTLSGNYPNFYRTIAYDDAQAQLQVEFATKTLKAKKVAVLHDKGDYGKGQAELAKMYFEKAGVEVALFEGITPGAVDYSAIVQKVKRSKVDLVTWGGYHPEASKILTLMRKKKMDTLFLGADGIKDMEFIKVAGEYSEGAYMTGPMDYSENPMHVTAVADHKAKYGEDPGAFFDSGYAAAVALLTAIEKAGSTDMDAISKVLKSQPVDTTLGEIKFDENGDATGIGFSVYQVQGGDFVQQ